MNKVSGVYKITNNITGDSYIGSSLDIKKRWANHKSPSTWNVCPNNPLYLDFQKYGLENFSFEIMERTDQLKKREQYFIDLLRPKYNNYNANGVDIERKNEYQKEYQKEYRLSDKGKDSHKKSMKKYSNQLCLYQEETLTLRALGLRFYKQGIPYPFQSAKEYLLRK